MKFYLELLKEKRKSIHFKRVKIVKSPSLQILFYFNVIQQYF